MTLEKREILAEGGFDEEVRPVPLEADEWKHGNLGQGIYIDPKRDFVGVYFSTNGYIPPYGEDKMPGFLRRSAKYVAGEYGE